MASKGASAIFSALSRPARNVSRTTSRAARLNRPAAAWHPSISLPSTGRFAHSIPRPPPSTPSAIQSESQSQAPQQASRPQQPSYELSFTCVPCGTRSAHNISKQGYHHGSVLITCPSCRNRHIISDHLNIFGNRKITVEDLMREKGQLVKRGTLGEDGDVEFWEDGTTTNREERLTTEPAPRANKVVDDGSAPGTSFGRGSKGT